MLQKSNMTHPSDGMEFIRIKRIVKNDNFHSPSGVHHLVVAQKYDQKRRLKGFFSLCPYQNT